MAVKADDLRKRGIFFVPVLSVVVVRCLVRQDNPFAGSRPFAGGCWQIIANNRRVGEYFSYLIGVKAWRQGL